MLRALPPMKVSSTSTSPRQLAAVLTLMGKADAMQHEPRGFLRNAERATNFVTADSVLCVRDEPDAREPLIQAEGRVFKNSSDFNRELALWVSRTALPAKLILEKADFGPAASWTHNPARPLWATGNEIAQTVFRDSKIEDCFLKCLRVLFNGFHVLSVRRNLGLVKYMFTLADQPSGGEIVIIYATRTMRSIRL